MTAMSFSLRVEGLGKLYAINQAAGTWSLRDRMAAGLDRLLGRAGGAAQAVTGSEDTGEKTRPRAFWALRDVSFDVMEGERIGIIGANGAGKSTLLKILSRVTLPTEGRAEIRGRVASLLEVGTGFHPELSGRENVFLNGAILGMSRSEIARKFDQIVDFAGVEKFIDTPVKHYSSGMYVRLAFSVSAWLDPDILILDEVLAVGDQGFQKKCEIRMKELTKEGRTVLFVSHSMATVNKMCQKALYLEKGRVVSFGPVGETTDEYEDDVIAAAGIVRVPPEERSLENPAERGGSQEARVTALTVGKPARGRALPRVAEGGRLTVDVAYEVASPLPKPGPIDLAIGIDNEEGGRLFTTVSSWAGVRYDPAAGGGSVQVTIADLRLRPGLYLVSVALINEGNTLDAITHCGAFEVTGKPDVEGIVWRADYGSARFPVTYTK